MKKLLKSNKYLIIAGLLFLLPAFLPAQTAAELDSLRKASLVTCSQAARFVAASASGEVAPAQRAFEQAMEKGWLPKGTTADESISLGKLSLLITKAFNIKGGIMYMVLPGQRYAFRTMTSRSFIQGDSDPAMKVSGERFLRILDRVLNEEEGE